MPTLHELKVLGDVVTTGAVKSTEKIQGSEFKAVDDIYTQVSLYSTYDYALNRNWSLRLNNFGSGNWGGIALKQSSVSQGEPDVVRFGVDINGNVGIGTDSPTHYDYHTSLTIGNISSKGLLKFSGPYNSGSGAEIYQENDGLLRFNVNASKNVMNFLANGNVGIGVTDPDTKLEVDGVIKNGSIWINDGTNSNDFNENIRLFSASNGASVIAFNATGAAGVPTTSIIGYSDRLETRFGLNWKTRVSETGFAIDGNLSAGNFTFEGSTNVIIKNNPAISNGSYSAGNNHIELRTTDGSDPSIGFHRQGLTGLTLYHSTNNTLRLRDANTGSDSIIWHSGNDGHQSGMEADLLDGYHGSNYLYSKEYYAQNYINLGYGTGGVGYWHKLVDVTLVSAYTDYVISFDWVTRYSRGKATMHVHSDNDLLPDIYSAMVTYDTDNMQKSNSHFKYVITGSVVSVWIFTPGWETFKYFRKDIVTESPPNYVWYDSTTGAHETTEPSGPIFNTQTGTDAYRLQGYAASNFLLKTGGTMSGNIIYDNYGLGVIGKYDSARFQNVFAMGPLYTMKSDGTSLTNDAGTDTFYGIAWTHSNNANDNGRKIAGHHAIFVTGGVTKSAIGDHIWTGGNITGSDITAGSQIYLTAQGAGVYMKDETTATQWHVHMHGDRLRLYDGTTEQVLLSAGDVVHVENSSKLYSIDEAYKYGSTTPYYGYLTYVSANGRWRFQMEPATPASIEVAYADTAGNAANADTIDSIDSSQIVYGAGVTKSNTISNFDTPLGSGFYDGNTATGSPTGEWYALLNVRHNNPGNNHGFQITGNFYDSGKLYYRPLGGSDPTTSSWVKIWNESNDGSGSGLDADLLDGYHVSAGADANTIVMRDANNYIYANYINSNRGDETSAAASYLYDSGDGWIRKKSLANTKSELLSGFTASRVMVSSPFGVLSTSSVTSSALDSLYTKRVLNNLISGSYSTSSNGTTWQNVFNYPLSYTYTAYKIEGMLRFSFYTGGSSASPRLAIYLSSDYGTPVMNIQTFYNTTVSSSDGVTAATTTASINVVGTASPLSIPAGSYITLPATTSTAFVNYAVYINGYVNTSSTAKTIYVAVSSSHLTNGRTISFKNDSYLNINVVN